MFFKKNPVFYFINFYKKYKKICLGWNSGPVTDDVQTGLALLPSGSGPVDLTVMDLKVP